MEHQAASHGHEVSVHTRERILDAAETLFARNGFGATSVRDITAAAGVNVAAINYHFGGKDSLYREVVLRRLRQLRDARLAAIRAALASEARGGRLEHLLRSYARTALAPVLAGPEERAVVDLLTREMTEMRLPAGEGHVELMREVDAELSAALRRVEPGVDEPTAVIAVHAIQFQLYGLFQAARCQGTLPERSAYGIPFADAVEAIVRFTAAGIRGAAGEGNA